MHGKGFVLGQMYGRQRMTRGHPWDTGSLQLCILRGSVLSGLEAVLSAAVFSLLRCFSILIGALGEFQLRVTYILHYL